MGKYAEAFRKERLKNEITLRQINAILGLSIGFLSDMENGKKNPPEISIVRKFEEIFGITDGYLVRLAKEERVTIPSTIGQMIRFRPELQEVLLRAEALGEDDFNDFLNSLRQKSADDQGEKLFSDWFNLIFFDDELGYSI